MILVVTKNLKKFTDWKRKILPHEVGKYEKVTIDLMPLYAYAKLFTRARPPRSIKYLRVRNDQLSSGRILCDKEIFFPYDGFTGYKKSNQNQSGRALPFAFALTCYKIYFLYSCLSDFDLFRWRVHLSDDVCRLRARVQLKTLSSLLKLVFLC